MPPHPNEPWKAWAMDDAEQRFDELLRCAVEDGPQFIERHGEAIVVVVAADEYRLRKQQETGHRAMSETPERGPLDPWEPPLAEAGG